MSYYLDAEERKSLTASRQTFARMFLETRKDDLPNIWFTKKFKFYLSYPRLVDSYSPPDFYLRTQFIDSIQYWVAFSKHGLFVSHMFKIDDQKVFRNLINEYFVPMLEANGLRDTAWFMEDTQPTTTRLDFLHQTFHGRVICQGYAERFGTGMDFPHNSSILNPCEYYLFHYLMGRISSKHYETFNELKDEVTKQLTNIDRGKMEGAVLDFETRLKLLIHDYENLNLSPSCGYGVYTN